MRLEGKTAIVYGGSGALGGAAAQAFAREGARVHLVGRTQEKLEARARAIRDGGGEAHVAALDVLDLAAVERHAAGLAGVDIALVAVGIAHVQGVPLAELGADDFMHPVESYMRAHINVAKAVAPHMMRQQDGVVMAISTQGAVLGFPGALGYGVACAAIEGFTRQLAADLGAHGARAVCIRSDAIPEASAQGSHSQEVFAPIAAGLGLSVQEMLAEAAKGKPLKRMATLAEFGESAVFAATARSMTGAAINITAGAAYI
ncbi:MAG: SDR family NAD(P)-dependent oxidoreductase [Vitreimonas sp.]